jgi:hypothetical protein
LAKCLAPQDSAVRRLLGKVSDLSNFCTIKTIEQRSEDGLKADLGFQKEVQKLIDEKKITDASFILSDTGHDIPVVAQILENKDLKAKGVFFFPELKKKCFKSRIPAQASIWGEQIRQAEKENANKQGALFIGLETHRIPPEKKGPLSLFDKEINPKTLPSAGELMDQGIDHVVYMKEAPPAAYEGIDSFVKFDIKEYLKTLEKEGLEVKLYGIDPRRRRKEGQS